MKNGFIFYRDRCVGCEACVVACALENGPHPPLAWRRVTHLNPQLLPGVPALEWSMACNHCENAACLEACPSAAIYRDPETGAVILDESRCLGCGYCSWACPYDAPVYNWETGVMNKCTLCLHRIREGDLPACVSGCPVGALDYGIPDEPTEESLSEEVIPTELKPALYVVTNHSGKSTVPTISRDIRSSTQQKETIRKKLSLRHEWPLLIFTLIVPLLAGLTARFMFKPQSWITITYVVLGLIAGLVSLLHLGKKRNAYRAIYNIGNSWLSREIAGFLLMLASGFLFQIFPGSMLLGWMTLGFSVITLVFIDQVYAYARNKYTFLFHSSGMLITGFMWISVAWLQGRPIIFLGVLKFVLTVVSVVVIYRGRKLPTGRIIWYTLRILCLTVAVSYLLRGPAYIPVLTALLFIGEAIDRGLFYADQELRSQHTHFAEWPYRKSSSLKSA